VALLHCSYPFSINRGLSRPNRSFNCSFHHVDSFDGDCNAPSTLWLLSPSSGIPGHLFFGFDCGFISSSQPVPRLLNEYPNFYDPTTTFLQAYPVVDGQHVLPSEFERLLVVWPFGPEKEAGLGGVL
jgi:hypothetical protein